MTSIQSLWALAYHLGFDPAAFLAKTSETVIVDASSKAAAAVGRRVAQSVQVVLSRWAKRIDDSFPERLWARLRETDEVQRSALAETVFVGREFYAAGTCQSSPGKRA